MASPASEPKPEYQPNIATLKRHPFVVQVAEMCHEVNRVYCRIFTNESQAPWDSAPEWQKESAIDGVIAHLMSNFRLNPEQSHNAWLEAKLRAGWTYGEAKDADKKQHPCMLPFKALPISQRLKDELFKDTCKTAFVLRVAPYNDRGKNYHPSHIEIMRDMERDFLPTED